VDIPIVKALLGTDINFTIQLTNTGTAVDTYSLLVGELPAGVSYWFLDPVTEVDHVTVGPKGTVELELGLDLPSTMKAMDFSFWIGAASASGMVVRSDMVVEFRLPDIRVKDVVFDDKEIEAGQTREVEVLLANSGDSKADDVIVNVNGKVKEISFGPGEDGDLTFDIKFEAWDTQLVVVVDPGNDVPEKKEDNNHQVEEVDVKGGVGAVPGFEIIYIIITISFSFFLINRKIK